jgi:reductive dehalogenase
MNNRNFPFPVPGDRFDQKNDMFKRRAWDDSVGAYGNQLYQQVKYQDRYGFRKLDYALRNASWNIEYDYAMGNMRGNHGLYSWTRIADKAKRFVETGDPVTHSPETNSRVIKKAARFLGADLTGICKLHPNLVYSHEYRLPEKIHSPVQLPEDCTNTIVMAVEMDYDAARCSPDGIAGASTGLGYTRQAVLANLVAAFIRGLGYKAVPSGNDTALSIPLAMAAGLGELGRNGLLITEKYGPRVRLCKVFTNLPLSVDNFRSFGVEKFCKTCKKCARKCPSRSISFDDPTLKGPTMSNHSGVKKWYINPEECFKFWAKNRMDCNNCVCVCPFNKPKGILHDAARFSIKHLPALNRLLLLFDDLLGYGNPIKNKNFWETP